VRGFIKQYADGEFDPDTIRILTQAFDDALQRAQMSKRPYLAEEYTEAGRIMRAKHIITAAKAGKRDPRWLADSALLYLSRQNLRRGAAARHARRGFLERLVTAQRTVERTTLVAIQPGGKPWNGLAGKHR
jgi:hypothetical protein